MTTEPPPSGGMDGHSESDHTRDALSLAEEAEADAEAALAEAHAKAARARAERLRRQAQAITATPAVDLTKDAPAATDDDADDAAATDDAAAALDDDALAPKSRLRRRIGVRPLAVSAAVVLLCALLGLSGFMAWQLRAANQLHAREAEAAAVARQGVVNIMSLDFTNAEGDVQRVIDSATGKFKEDFESESKFLIEALEKSKVITEVTVNAVAVDSLNDDTAVVLVSAKSQASNAEDQRQDPQQFRVAVTLARDSGALKMSQVDFL